VENSGARGEEESTGISGAGMMEGEVAAVSTGIAGIAGEVGEMAEVVAGSAIGEARGAGDVNGMV
jgi:hypothetical protein